MPSTRTAVALLLVLTFALTACSGDPEPTQSRARSTGANVAAAPAGSGNPAMPGTTGSTGTATPGTSGTGTRTGTGTATGDGSDAVGRRNVDDRRVAGPQAPTNAIVTSPAEPDTGTSKAGLIDWIMRYTPSGGGWGAYHALSKGDCDEALKRARRLSSQKRSLYRAAAHACLALSENKADLWDAAQRDADTLGAAPKLRRCMDTDVHRLLKTLLSQHRAAATAPLNRNPDNARAIANSTCPRVVDVAPGRGRPAGGQPVTLKFAGDNVPKRVDVDFGDHTIARVRVKDDGTAVVKAPSRRAAGGKRTVPVQLSDWRGTDPLTHFTYRSKPGTSP